jgi:TP901 family phage tail tape measure protein
VRTVSVKYVANMKPYLDGVKEGVKATQDFRRELKDAAAQGKVDLDLVANGAIAFGAALGAVLGAGITMAAEFEHSMSQVKAVSGATEAEFESLRQAAIDMGSSTQFSATEAADAIGELSKAGLTAAEISGGALAGALALAAAGGIGLAEAATIASVTLKQFNLEASEMSAVADTLAGSANASNTDVSGLGQSLKNVGTVAAQMGLTVEETVGFLSAMGDQAIVGAEAGTALKTTLLRLLAPTGEAKELMDELGISVYDANGNVLDAVDIVKELETGFGNLSVEQRTAAMNTIFGAEAIAGANVIMAEGSAGLQDYIDKVSEEGVAAETAAARIDNLKGDVGNLTSAIEGLAIQSSGGATDGLRLLTQTATDLLGAINEIPTPITNTIVVIGGLVAAGALMWGMTVKARDGLAQMNAQLAATGPAGTRAAAALSRVGSVAGGLLTAFAAIEAASALLGQVMYEDVNPQVEALALGLERWTQEGEISGEMARVLGEDFRDFGEALQYAGNQDLRGFMSWNDPINMFSNKMEDAEEKVAAVDSALASMVAGGNAEGAQAAYMKITAAALQAGLSLDEIKKLFPEYLAEMEITGEEAAALAEEQSAAMVSPYALQMEYLAGHFELTGETSAAAVQEMLDAWSEGATAFVDLMGAYEAALAGLEEDQALTTQAFIDSLRQQVEAQEEWAANMENLAARVPAVMLDELARMGPEGAEMVALMREMTDEELAEVVELWGRRGDEVGDEIAAGILQGTGAAEEGLENMQDVINSLTGKNVTITVTMLNQIATGEFGGNASQIVERWGGVSYKARKGLLRADVYSAMNPARYMFAEPETGGEAFIPKRGDYDRSMAILSEAASWYGAELIASGGRQWRGARPVAIASTTVDGDSTSAASRTGRAYGSTVVEHQEVIVKAHTDDFSYSQVMDQMSWHGAY